VLDVCSSVMAFPLIKALLQESCLPIAVGVIPACAILNAGNAKAILVYELIEQGSDVRVEQSGSLSGLINSTAGGFNSPARIRPERAQISFGGGTFSALLYTISGPTNFGSGVNIDFSVAVAPPIRTFLGGNSGSFYIEDSYVEGTPITSSGLITGQSLATLGLNAISGLLGTWTIGSDSIEVWAGAKPAPVPGPLPLMGAGTAFAFSRRLRARLHRARRSLEA
jgi:hypothetical protein